MLSDEIRKRLALIHRPPLQSRGPLPLFDAARASASTIAPRTLDTWQSDGQECENASGKHWRIRRPLVDLCPAAATANLQPRSPGAGNQPVPHPELAAVAAHFPQGALFLDLETCGFAGSPVFLAGTVWHDDGELVLDQLFARHYGEERAVLESLWRIAARSQVLVTFNGKSFDWPMVHDRSTRHHLGRDMRGSKSCCHEVDAASGLSRHAARPELAHCDVLHHARRRWKHVLPNCRLQTLERYICNRWRKDDLSGALVPTAYQEFVRWGRTQGVAAILHHNALDLATLVQLAVRLAPA